MRAGPLTARWTNAAHIIGQKGRQNASWKRGLARISA